MMEKDVENSEVRPAEEEIETPKESDVENTNENELEKPLEQENAVEESSEKDEKKPISNYSKVIKGTIIALCSLLILYGGMSAYFMNHYYFGSEVNCINVSGKTVKAAEALIESELHDYTLTLKKRGGETEQIKAEDVGLKYTSYEALRELKDNQNPFGWILACFDTKDSKIEVEVSYDEKLLRERVDKLSCFDSSKVVEPQNPSFQYSENGFTIINEVQGNKVAKNVLYTHVANALLKRAGEIDLESLDCYITPRYHSQSQKVLAAYDTLNKYASADITYTIGGTNEVLNGTAISKWLIVSENFDISIDEKKVHEYIEWLSEKYDTKGRSRSFVTSSGETIQIGGGDFGRSMNKVKETENLISDIKAGRKTTKEPVYSQTVFSHGSSDIADTYVEIDMTKQHIWFYKGGALIIDGDIVTGNVKAGHTTPKGVYSLKYKAKNAVLRGRGYAAPVDYWMPFNGGIGIHDASWRDTFGGNIYKTNGSHGCINCPYNVAKEIYYNIEIGTPVICY